MLLGIALSVSKNWIGLSKHEIKAKELVRLGGLFYLTCSG